MRKALSFIALLLHVFCFGQSGTLDSMLQMQSRSEVKELGHFFERFDMRDTVGLKNGASPNRFTNILSLFDMQNEAFLADSQIIIFAQQIMRSEQIIGYHDNNWYALVYTEFTWNGSKKEVPITLKYIKNKGLGYSWIIVGIDLTTLSVELRRSAAKSIVPMNNEINFIDLSKALENKKELASYTDDSYMPDYLSIFLYLVESGRLNFVQIRKITYHFLNVPDWIFTVENFSRLTNNSGWLISSLFVVPDAQKSEYRKHILKAP